LTKKRGWRRCGEKKSPNYGKKKHPPDAWKRKPPGGNGREILVKLPLETPKSSPCWEGEGSVSPQPTKPQRPNQREPRKRGASRQDCEKEIWEKAQKWGGKHISQATRGKTNKRSRREKGGTRRTTRTAKIKKKKSCLK